LAIQILEVGSILTLHHQSNKNVMQKKVIIISFAREGDDRNKKHPNLLPQNTVRSDLKKRLQLILTQKPSRQMLHTTISHSNSTKNQ